MAAPALIPIIKKVATYILTNPKALKKVVGIVIGVVVIIAMPIIALLGIFTGGVNLNIDRLQEMIVENQSSFIRHILNQAAMDSDDIVKGHALACLKILSSSFPLIEVL